MTSVNIKILSYLNLHQMHWIMAMEQYPKLETARQNAMPVHGINLYNNISNIVNSKIHKWYEPSK